MMLVDHTVLVVCWLAVSKNKEIQVFREPQTTRNGYAPKKRKSNGVDRYF